MFPEAQSKMVKHLQNDLTFYCLGVQLFQNSAHSPQLYPDRDRVWLKHCLQESRTVRENPSLM